MTSKVRPAWSPEMDRALAELKGKTGSECAAIMSAMFRDLTRSAVIARRRRILANDNKLKEPRKPRKPKGKVQKQGQVIKRVVNQGNWSMVLYRRADMSAVQVEMFNLDAGLAPVSFEEATRRNCCLWPIGDPLEDTKLFCGAKRWRDKIAADGRTIETVYCAHHDFAAHMHVKISIPEYQEAAE